MDINPEIYNGTRNLRKGGLVRVTGGSYDGGSPGLVDSLKFVTGRDTVEGVDDVSPDELLDLIELNHDETFRSEAARILNNVSYGKKRFFRKAANIKRMTDILHTESTNGDVIVKLIETFDQLSEGDNQRTHHFIRKIFKNALPICLKAISGGFNHIEETRQRTHKRMIIASIQLLIKLAYTEQTQRIIVSKGFMEHLLELVNDDDYNALATTALLKLADPILYGCQDFESVDIGHHRRMSDTFILMKMNIGRFLMVDIQRLQEDQLYIYLGIIIQVLQSNESLDSPDTKRLWDTLLSSINRSRLVSQLFYYYDKCGILDTDKVPTLQFYLSQKLQNTDAFWDIFSSEKNLAEKNVFEDLDLCDVMYGSSDTITRMSIVKVFKSAARPYLLRFSFDGDTEDKMAIFKYGDDLRLDMMVQNMFHIFQNLWDHSILKRIPILHTYKTLPLGDNFGLIELVTNVQSINGFDWVQLIDRKEYDDEQLDILLRSMAGGYVAGWVLGIRDRHQDNMLIKDDSIFLHIDFGHLFNDRTPINDAPRFSIPKEFKLALVKRSQPSNFESHETPIDYYNDFIVTCQDAFRILHRNSGLICNLASLQFSPIEELSDQVIRTCLFRSLLVDLTEEKACEKITNLIESGINSIKKGLKYKFHNIGMDMKERQMRKGGIIGENAQEVRIEFDLEEYYEEGVYTREELKQKRSSGNF
eukprot:TRINITY_DN4704_c0_g1_i2.p1 TRINITY_DN4704_c0_g1~~TRINITY_DN4704_c0_g1_i2.p1  ORF type:complete len:702 (+),score=139.47 TRINITY_DN4704_c0_g1_i2:25-2130(+)